MIVLISETFGGHKMKNTSYKNKQFVLLGMTFLSVAGIAGCSKVELAQSSVTLELGDELSENVADYLQNPDEKILKDASLDLSAVDETKVGSYNAAVAYDGKNYPFTVEVKDTTSPQCEAKDYIYMQPGTLTVDDLVTEIKDASETSSGIVSCEQKEDLVVCDYDDMLQERAAVDTADPYDEVDYQESVQLDDEGCYEVTAQVKDSEGNFTDITLNVYVDGTAPELAQNVIDLEVDASGISIDDINTDDAEKIADMLHELPDFANAEWAAASDAFCGDNAISYEFEQKSFNLQKENPVEVLNVHCTVQDQAGNENEADYEVMVTYTGLDAEALLEKTGLIMQIADTSTNNNSTSSNNNMTKSDGKSNKNQNGEYKGNDTVNDLGMTDAEFAAMFDSMTPEEREAFLNSVAYGSTTDNNVQVSGYYDNNMAQEVFNLTNQERANNGLPAYSWDSNMASYSDRRAKEIVTDYSHNSAGGNWSVGENIAEGETSASEVVNDWMNSAGHKANILSDVSTKTSVSCYVENFTYADGSTQYLYHWVQNFTH
jgi:uncharacterized protein YkwD